jgi:pimeloyl-ACP methyl ester carboxylesterase
MRVTSNHPTQISQAAFGPSTLSTAASPQGTRPSRPALKDGFERVSAASARPVAVESLFQEQFGTLATDAQQFHQTMRNVFGQGYDTAKAEQFRQQALSGDFGWMPKVEWVDASVLQGGHGAYDSGTGVVLLNRELQGDPSLAATTYVEEAGHHLDAQLNTVDSQGDEGELFRRVLGGEKLSRAQIASIRAENDKGTIQLDGRDVEVEFRRGLLKRFGDAIRNTVDDVGDAIRNTAEEVGGFVGNIANNAVDLTKNILGAFGLGSQPDRQFDGKLVGSGSNAVFEPGTPLHLIPAVTPQTLPSSPRSNRSTDNPATTVLYVNGILTDLASQQSEMQQIANSTGMRVIGIHNSTEGAAADVFEATQDKLSLLEDVTGVDRKGSNPAVDTLADAMYTELKAGRDVHVMGYSQGALITARALRDLAQRLRVEDGLPQAQVEQLMSRINVETFGGAGAIFPDGPNYVHYVNTRDIVPMAFGQGNGLDPLREPGRGAVVHTFTAARPGKFVDAHDLDESYLSHRVPFQDARNGDFYSDAPRGPRTAR